MKLYHELERESARPLVLAIGFFDGFHVGHREIARRAIRLRKPGWRSGVLSFVAHPASHLRPGTEPPQISTAQERLCLFAGVGFEECFFVRFDERIATLSPLSFLEILAGRLGVHGIVVGETFRFGHKRAGDTALMKRFCEEHGIAFVGVEPICADGERVSSTRIRGLIERGDLATADRLLGGSGYEIRGPVELGAGRGHALGFPTANICVPEKLLPNDGVYSATARYDGRDYAALVSIGSNPQFGGTAHTVEAWLRDFPYTIYGRELSLRDLRFVRKQRLFPSVGELIAQMERDVAAVGFPAYG
ncbi:MAG TPA: riboflavin biosynthesis protein RibF [Candidatus Cybelea sp.]